MSASAAPDGHPDRPFDEVLAELSTTRLAYESAEGAQRADLHEKLVELRRQMAGRHDIGIAAMSDAELHAATADQERRAKSLSDSRVDIAWKALGADAFTGLDPVRFREVSDRVERSTAYESVITRLEKLRREQARRLEV